MNEETFSTAAYPDAPRKAEAAKRIRAVLEQHEKAPMTGLRVTDRLVENLSMDLLAEPDFFFALEEEFGIATPVHEYEQISALVERQRTVGDLVDYVESQQWSK